MARRVALCLMAIALIAFGSLVAGASYLEWSLPGGLPFGNALTATGLSAASGAAIGVSKHGSVLRWLSVISFCLSIAWLPVSVFLAGNLMLNFDNDNGWIWFFLSVVIIGLASVSMLWAIVRMLSGEDSGANSTEAV